MIKRLEDALADNDVVLGTIIAGATNHSAESVSITVSNICCSLLPLLARITPVILPFFFVASMLASGCSETR